MYHAAKRANNTWSYLAANLKPMGPLPPLPGKNALIAITCNGTLRFLYGDSDNCWHEKRLELSESSPVEHIITHASFVPENQDDLGQSDASQKTPQRKSPDGSLLLATYDSVQTLKVYRVLVRWNSSPDSKAPKLSPGMTVLKLTQIDHAVPEEVAIFEPQRAVLSSLKLYSPVHDFVTKRSHPSVLMATYTTFDLTMSMTRNAGHISSTIVCRWNISDQGEDLHPCFTNLSSKKNGPTSIPEVSKVLHPLFSIDQTNPI